MLTGLIDALEVEGRKLVVQTEDRGSEREEIVTSAFEGGKLVYRRVVPYADLTELRLSDHEVVLASALRDLHNCVLRDLAGGEIALERAG
jgi:hypothetical protein